jgi:hypothetical protein
MKFKNYFYKFNFTSAHNKNKATSKEIKNTLKKLQARTILSSFSNYQTFGKWTTNNEAIDVFKSHIVNIKAYTKLNLYQEEQIFHDLKQLLANLIKTNTKNINDIYFFTELTIMLRQIYIENFKDTEFISNNVPYGLSSFIFLRHLCENEYIIKNSTFLRDLFDTIETCTKLLIEDSYINDRQYFLNNINLMDEFLNKLSMIIRSRYISSYNPFFFLTEFRECINKVFNRFENYFLHICLNYPLKLSQEKIKNYCDLLYSFEIKSERSIDYINIFLLKHKTYISTFYLIDILNSLSKYKQVNNYLILNYLYYKLHEDLKNKVVNIYPKLYIFNAILILSKNSVQGSFVIIEALVKILIDKYQTEINLKDICNIILSCTRARYIDRLTYDSLFTSLKGFFDINYISIRYIKTVLDRLMTEEYSNTELFELIYSSCLERQIELTTMLDKDVLDITKFREYIKNEMMRAKETILLETISSEDYAKYMNMCQIAMMHCLFKIRKGYRYQSPTELVFINNDKEESFKYLDYTILLNVKTIL